MNTNHNLDFVCCGCKRNLVGRQKKFCSVRCKQRSVNYKHQNYKNQQERGLFRKIKLMQMFGAKCNECGYDKNFACLTFHHKNPKTKKFCLDLRVCSNKSWKSLLEEVAKCELLCNRCHGEHHNPQLNAKDCYDKMNKFIEFNDSLNKYKKIDCLYCRQSFHPNKYTQKYCSEKCCKLNSRKVTRPSKEELEKDLSEMSYVKTGAKYGVSDNAVRKWIKQYSKLN